MTSETAQAIAAGMPPCRLCGGRNVRASGAVRFEDKLRAIFRYTPYRCRGCRHRLYWRPKSGGAASGGRKGPASEASAPSPGSDQPKAS